MTVQPTPDNVLGAYADQLHLWGETGAEPSLAVLMEVANRFRLDQARTPGLVALSADGAIIDMNPSADIPLLGELWDTLFRDHAENKIVEVDRLGIYALIWHVRRRANNPSEYSGA